MDGYFRDQMFNINIIVLHFLIQAVWVTIIFRFQNLMCCKRDTNNKPFFVLKKYHISEAQLEMNEFKGIN